MNSKLVTVLGAICGVLLLLIGGEWFYASLSQRQLLDAQVPKDKKASTDAMPSIDLTGQDEESYADLVNRPLFIEGRKPVNEPPPETVKGTEVAVNFDWVLNGIYTTGKGQSVLLSRPATTKSPTNNHRRIPFGGVLDGGWRLVEIVNNHIIYTPEGSKPEAKDEGDRVIFTLDNEQKTLLLHKSKPKSPTKPNVPPPSPGGQPEGVPPEGMPPDGVPPPAPESPEDLMPEPESPEDLIENSENE
ncbi:MAG: hypothetical protein PHU14_00995 [Methylovulum sp.]|nr:hypothetical protein [Methylovulum sp.]